MPPHPHRHRNVKSMNDDKVEGSDPKKLRACHNPAGFSFNWPMLLRSTGVRKQRSASKSGMASQSILEYKGYSDVYGHSDEDDNCVCQRASSNVHDRSKKNPISKFFTAEQELAEDSDEDDGTESSENIEKTRQRLQSMSLESAIVDLVPEEEMLLKLCLEEIHDVVGESVPDSIIISQVLRHKFNTERALEAVLSEAKNYDESGEQSEPGLGIQTKPVKFQCEQNSNVRENNLHLIYPSGRSSLLYRAMFEYESMPINFKTQLLLAKYRDKMVDSNSSVYDIVDEGDSKPSSAEEAEEETLKLSPYQAFRKAHFERIGIQQQCGSTEGSESTGTGLLNGGGSQETTDETKIKKVDRMKLFSAQPVLKPSSSVSSEAQRSNLSIVLGTKFAEPVPKPIPLFVAKKTLSLKPDPLFAAQNPIAMKSSPIFAAQKPLVIKLKQKDVFEDVYKPTTALPTTPVKAVQTTPAKTVKTTPAKTPRSPFGTSNVRRIHLQFDQSLIKEAPSVLGSRMISSVKEKRPKFFHHSELGPLQDARFSEAGFKFDTPSPDMIIRAGLANQSTGFQIKSSSVVTRRCKCRKRYNSASSTISVKPDLNSRNVN